MAEKELRVDLLVIMTLVCILEALTGAEITEVVTRRDSGDTYQLSMIKERAVSVCNEGNNITYLVSEQQCVRNQELLSDRGWLH